MKKTILKHGKVRTMIMSLNQQHFSFSKSHLIDWWSRKLFIEFIHHE